MNWMLIQVNVDIAYKYFSIFWLDFCHKKSLFKYKYMYFTDRYSVNIDIAYLKFVYVISTLDCICFLTNYEWLLKILLTKNNLEIFYKYSPIFFELLPKEIVDLWIKFGKQLNPSKLLPSIASCRHSEEQVYRNSFYFCFMASIIIIF